MQTKTPAQTWPDRRTNRACDFTLVQNDPLRAAFRLEQARLGQEFARTQRERVAALVQGGEPLPHAIRLVVQAQTQAERDAWEQLATDWSALAFVLEQHATTNPIAARQLPALRAAMPPS